MEDNIIPQEDPKESIKLVKNTKGFNWELKLKSDLLNDEDLKRLNDLNKKMEYLYGEK